MRQVLLTQGKVALVDDEDFETVSQYRWFAQFDRYNWYAVRQAPRKNGKQKPIRMHNFLLQPKEGFEVDHINHDGLDNRRENLLVCSHAENLRNWSKARGVSKYIGVSWCNTHKKWKARINVDGKRISLGYFSSEKEAISAIEKFKEG
jgi:hypothetical protein